MSPIGDTQPWLVELVFRHISELNHMILSSSSAAKGLKCFMLAGIAFKYWDLLSPQYYCTKIHLSRKTPTFFQSGLRSQFPRALYVHAFTIVETMKICVLIGLLQAVGLIYGLPVGMYSLLTSRYPRRILLLTMP